MADQQVAVEVEVIADDVSYNLAEHEIPYSEEVESFAPVVGEGGTLRSQRKSRKRSKDVPPRYFPYVAALSQEIAKVVAAGDEVPFNPGISPL